MLWHEGLSGRSGNDIASALLQMLRKIELRPGTTELILWTDSCVPQKNNSLMSLALIRFLCERNVLCKITQKFCEPGYSSIQEVDNTHSQIERSMRCSEMFSPLGVVRLMLSVNRKNPFSVIQINDTDYLHFSRQSFNFSAIPYTEVKIIEYNKISCCIRYKKSFTSDFVNVCVLPGCNCSLPGFSNTDCVFNDVLTPTLQSSLHHDETLSTGSLTNEKISDIKSMFKYTPTVDRQFMESVIRQTLKSTDSNC